jgi:hypothetical protein
VVIAASLKNHGAGDILISMSPVSAGQISR